MMGTEGWRLDIELSRQTVPKLRWWGKETGMSKSGCL